MATTTFIAVQCFGCSTMQVKQQKKSSNKWTCVVCNEKQSVRKVHARNSMAKHVRSFVQSFNMSRKFADEDADKSILHHQTLTDEIPHPLPSLNDNSKRKSMTDWTAYLDPDEQDDAPATVEEEDTHGPKVVTELPAEMFKKPRLSRSDLKEKGGLYKPNFSKGTNSAAADYHLSSQEVKSNDGDAKAGYKECSKWTAYLTRDEAKKALEIADVCFNSHPRNCTADIANTTDAFSMQFEEDIHPDFM